MDEGDSIEKDSSFVPELGDSIPRQDAVDDNSPQKIWKLPNQYKLLRTFECKEDAEEYLREENCWVTKKHQYTEVGTIRLLRCNRVNARGQQCNACTYLWFESMSFQVLFFESLHFDDIRSAEGNWKTFMS